LNQTHPYFVLVLLPKLVLLPLRISKNEYISVGSTASGGGDVMEHRKRIGGSFKVWVKDVKDEF